MTVYHKTTREEQKFIEELFNQWRCVFDVGAEVFKLDTPKVGTKEDYLISLACEFLGYLAGKEIANSSRGAEKMPVQFAKRIAETVEASVLRNYNTTVMINLRDRANSDIMFQDLMSMLTGLGMSNPFATAAKYGITPDSLKQVVEEVLPSKGKNVKGTTRFNDYENTVVIYPSEPSDCDCNVCKVANGHITEAEYKSNISIADDFVILVACPTCDEAGCNDCEGKGTTSLADYHTRRKVKAAHPH